MQAKSFFVGVLDKMSSLDHSQQIAVSNLSLTMLVLLSVFIPVLMISRGGKRDENQYIVRALFNPFYAKNTLEEIVLGLNAEARAAMNASEENAYEMEIFGWTSN